jgi:hypothetical protein
MCCDVFLIQTSEYILKKSTLIGKYIFLSNLSDNNVIYIDETYLFFHHLKSDWNMNKQVNFCWFVFINHYILKYYLLDTCLRIITSFLKSLYNINSLNKLLSHPSSHLLLWTAGWRGHWWWSMLSPKGNQPGWRTPSMRLLTMMMWFFSEIHVDTIVVLEHVVLERGVEHLEPMALRMSSPLPPPSLSPQRQWGENRII